MVLLGCAIDEMVYAACINLYRLLFLGFLLYSLYHTLSLLQCRKPPLQSTLQ